MEKKQKGTIAGQLRKFSNFSICTVLINALLMFVFLLVIGLNFHGFYNVEYVTDKYQMEIRKDVQTINKRLLFALASNDAGVTASQKEDLEARFTKISGYFGVISKNLNNATLGNELSEDWNAVRDASFEMLALVDAGNISGALEYYNSTLNDVSETLADALDYTGSLAEAQAKKRYVTINIITFFAVFVLCASFAIIVVINRKKTKSLVQEIEDDLQVLIDATGEIAKGNVHVDIDYYEDNEIGKVADQLRDAVNSIVSYIDEISDIMATMASGKFDVKFNKDFEGDYKDIQTAIDSFTVEISQSMKEIMQVSKMVSDGAVQLADAGQSLADTVTGQANIVDELSVNVNKITDEISGNAGKAEGISRETGVVAEDIVAGNRKM